MKSINNFISFSQDDIANEGYNKDMAKLMKLGSINEARKCVKDAKAMARIKDFTHATKKLEEAKKLIVKSKNIVSASDEPPTRLSRILGYVTPIVTMLPSEEITNSMHINGMYELQLNM